MIKTILLIISINVLALVAYACDSNPSVPTETSTPKVAVDPQLDTLLDTIEKRSSLLETFQARMLFTQEQTLVDALTIRHGRLYYQARNGAVRFRIHFSDWQQIPLDEPTAGKPVVYDEDFAFDGLWLTRRNAHTKIVQRFEISKEPANKEQFRLGKGPFPLPFAIEKADVLKEFHIKLLKTDPNDPKNTDRLHFKPKEQSAFAEKYLSLELWISRKDGVPTQIRYETDDNEITTVTWSKIKIDKTIKPKLFQLKPAGPDWTTEENPLPQPTDVDDSGKTSRTSS